MPKFTLLSQYRREQISGPVDRVFSRIALRGELATRNSLCLIRDQREIAKALLAGCQLFAGEGPRPTALIDQPLATWAAVADSGQALLDLATRFRKAASAHRIAVTGSSGKTNTKDMIAHLLRQRYPDTAKTPGNLNDFDEVPLVITRLPAQAPFWVVEIGLDYHLEHSMQPRAAALRPQVAVVTNIGASHIAYLGSEAAIAKEKAELIRELAPGGLAVLNGDNRYCREMARLATGHRVVFFGLGPSNRVRATNIRQTIQGLHFTLWVSNQSIKCSLPLIGLYHVQNALAATAVAIWAGLGLKEIARGLRTYRPSIQHGRIYRTKHGLLADDGYNSNPTAMRQVLDTLNALRTRHQKVLVLGDMQELGSETERCYSQLAQDLEQTNLSTVIFLGRRIKLTYDRLPEQTRYLWAQDEHEVAAMILANGLDRGSLIWLKGNLARQYARLRRLLLVKLGRPRSRNDAVKRSQLTEPR